jgi:predicted dehydrogenase
MLERANPQTVIVCDVFEAHARMCIDAIERGVHVLTEKPAALTFEELSRLKDACARHPNVHLAGLMFSRYDAGFYTAWRLIRDGAIGDVRMIDARKSYKLGKREPFYSDRATYGGTIPWVGSHAIDWIMFLGAQPFQSVSAMHSAAHNGGHGTMERSAVCQFGLVGERFASVSIDYFRPANAPRHGDDWVRVVGTEGVIEARPDSVKLINRENDGSTPVATIAPERTFLEDFIAHAEGRARALVDATSTLALTDACLRARQAADDGRVCRFEVR